ncbi:hypothetical protein KAH37_00050 [bacterium]|nr:hypothetical protein [bacterium]
MKKLFFMMVTFLLVFKSHGVMAPIFCERISTANTEQVHIECDGFDFPAFSFIRARHDGENRVDIRKELPANDSCVPPGEYTYYLEQGCSCDFTDALCQNNLIVVVENHTIECVESGLPTEMTKEEFDAYFSEVDFDRDCCEEELSVNIETINFGEIAVGRSSAPQTVKAETSSCSSMPRDMAPEYSFSHESQNVFKIEVGESSESFIPRGHGNSEFIFSFTPTAVGDYSETIVFKKFMIEIEVQLSGKGVDTADSGNSVDDFDTADSGDSVDDADRADSGDSVNDADTAQVVSSGCSVVVF